MFVKFFKAQTPFVFFVLIIITMLLWGDVFISKNTNFILFNNVNVLFNLCFSWLENSKYISLVLSLLFIVIQAIWLNVIVVKSDITAKGTLVPSLIYVILICSNQELLSFNGVVLSGFFILYTLQIAFSIYGKDDIYMDVFKISMILSIASLFYLPIFLYLSFVWLIIMIYRATKFRLIIISSVGFIIPYLYTLFFYFWFDKTSVFYQHLKNIFYSFGLHHFNFGIYLDYMPIMIACLYVVSVIGLFRKINSRVIKTRKFIYIITWLLFLSLMIALFFSDTTLISLGLLSIPATFFVSDFFLSFKRNWLAELIFLMIIIFIIVEKVLLLQ